MRSLVQRDTRKLLFADGDGLQRDVLTRAFQREGIDVTSCSSGEQALSALAGQRFDCLVLGLRLRDMTVVELVRKMLALHAASDTPLVIYGADGYSRGEKEELKRLGQAALIKSVSAIDAVFEEATLYLHKAVSELPRKKKQLVEQLQKLSPELAGRTVLIVDDDQRNTFALASALQTHGMNVLAAASGRKAIEMLRSEPGIDIVFMDVMMPDLDGYDTVRLVRAMERFKDLPVIAITAHAMKGDREKCLEAGASDYLAKPVNVDQLVSMVRAWLLE
jgi:CheY-like chemotaxis protein